MGLLPCQSCLRIEAALRDQWREAARVVREIYLPNFTLLRSEGHIIEATHIEIMTCRLRHIADDLEKSVNK